MKKLLICIPLLFVVACQQDKTNELTKENIERADADRIKAIENDPHMTEADKQKAKEMMGYVPGKGRAAQMGR